jgi:tRNA(Ile)-lysidine synthase
MDLPAPTRTTAAFERRVAAALDAHVARSEPIVVACSGGPDSTAALIAIARARAGAGPVIAAHFDHGLRAEEEAAGDRLAVQALGERLGLPVVSGEALDVHPSEGAAREARYRWLASACVEAGVKWCATGHTLDDQAETVLLRLTRGSGLAGATAMAPAAAWPVRTRGGLRLVRPLLGIRRAEAAAYLDVLGVEARIDPSNALDSFDRNRIRHRVLPELRVVNPRAEEALSRFADLARMDGEALETWAGEAYASLVAVEDGAALVERAGLRALPPAIASRVVRKAAGALALNLEAGHVDSLLRLAGRRGSRLSVRGGELVVREHHVELRRVDSSDPAT